MGWRKSRSAHCNRRLDKHRLSTDPDLRTRWRLADALEHQSLKLCCTCARALPLREYKLTALGPSFWALFREVTVSSLLGEQHPKIPQDSMEVSYRPGLAAVCNLRPATFAYREDQFRLQCGVTGQGQLTPPARTGKVNSWRVCCFWVLSVR